MSYGRRAVPGMSGYGSWAGPTPGAPDGGAGGGGWEQDARLNPIASLKRKIWPVHFLPGKMTTDSSGRGTFVMTPQEDFQGFRVVFFENGLGAEGSAPIGVTGSDFDVEQIVVGTRVVNVAFGTTPGLLFNQYSDDERFDLPFSPADEEIIIRVSGGTANHTYYCCILGYAPGSPEYDCGSPCGCGPAYQGGMGARGMARMGYLPFGTTSIPAGATVNVSATPQEKFKGRRLAVAGIGGPLDSGAGVSNIDYLLIQNIQIGTRVESSQSAAAHPAILWSSLSKDDWVDFDTCSKNSTITISVTNTNPSQPAVFAAMMTGDVWYQDECG